MGWRRGANAEETARSIGNVINNKSNLVFANVDGTRISFELRSDDLRPESLVLFVDDPGGTDIIAEKNGVVLDARNASDFEDYRRVVEMVLEDGIISLVKTSCYGRCDKNWVLMMPIMFKW